jgi:hypothetical protein
MRESSSHIGTKAMESSEQNTIDALAAPIDRLGGQLAALTAYVAHGIGPLLAHEVMPARELAQEIAPPRLGPEEGPLQPTKRPKASRRFNQFLNVWRTLDRRHPAPLRFESRRAPKRWP